MPNAIDWSQIGLGVTGAAAAITGAAIGGPVGMGIAAGATAATGLGAQIANMFRKPPEVPGPTPGQMIAAERTETIAGRSMEAAGLSPAELNALEISQFGNRMRMQQVLNAFNQIYTMSPVEREVLSKNLINKEMEQRREQEAALVTMNREAVERNMTRALKASESQAAQETEIRKAEWNKRVQELSFEQGRWQNFGAAVGEVGDAAAGYLEYLDMQKEKALQEQKKEAKIMNTTTPASAIKGIELGTTSWDAANTVGVISGNGNTEAPTLKGFGTFAQTVGETRNATPSGAISPFNIGTKEHPIWTNGLFSIDDNGKTIYTAGW